MRRPSSFAKLMFGASGLTACAVSTPPPETATAPPDPIPIVGPMAYSPEERENEDPRLDDICQIDPAACPKLDVKPGPARPAQELYAVPQTSGDGGQVIELQGPLAEAPAVRRVALGDAAPAAPVPTAPDPIPVTQGTEARGELFDIEAKVQIEVRDIDKGRATLAELTRAANGQVMNEAVDNGYDRRGVSVSLRIPSAGVRAFLERLDEVGKVRSSTLETNEVSRKIADTEVLVRNLEQTLHRYEELLAKAANVSETIQVEAQLARVRTALDRVRSDLAWSKDRVARSTVYVTLSLAPEHAPLEPAAKLHPGLRATLMYDVVPSDAPVPSTGYAGGGLSIAWPRSFSLDLDLMTSLKEQGGDAIDFYIVTLGTDIYSDFLGNGTRRFLNPYVGFRTGFAHAPDQSLFPLGGTLGLDVYKSSGVLIAIEGRAYALIGRKEGVDVGFEPAFTVNIAY